MRDEFKDATEDFLDDRCAGWRKSWTFDSLLGQVNQVMDFDAERDGAMMTYTTAQLVDIVERERGRMRRIDDYNRKRERNASR